MRSRRLLVAGAICCAMGCALALLLSQHAAARTQSLPKRAEVHVELFRGLANVFSRGMDRLGERLNQQGYSARVFHHSAWRRVARQIAERRGGKRQIIVLIGHSLGANAVLLLARELERSNIPVDLIVTFDATDPRPVPGNVRHVVNFFQHNGFGRTLSGGPGFRGRLDNVDLTGDRSVSHTTIDEKPRLHDMVIDRIVAIVNQDTAGKIQPSR